MLLAEVLWEHPDELRADFQETYNLNIDDMGVAYSIGHASILCAQLPKSSRVFRSVNPALEWSFTDQLLAWLEYDLRIVSLQLGGAEEKQFKALTPMLPDSLLPNNMHAKEHVGMSIEEFDEFIKRRRKEVS